MLTTATTTTTTTTTTKAVKVLKDPLAIFNFLNHSFYFLLVDDGENKLTNYVETVNNDDGERKGTTSAVIII